MTRVRPVSLPQDAEAILAIDRSFRTDAVLAPVPMEMGVEFVTMDQRVTKVFPLDDLQDPDRPWDAAWVVEKNGGVRAFAAVGLEAWNRRLVLWHLYVDTPQRGQGLAKALLEVVETYAREIGALHIWLETSNQNLPGMEAYQALGFEMTGFDLTLYDATSAEGEFALFFSRPVE